MNNEIITEEFVDQEPQPILDQCQHVIGKFLGQTWSKNFERYACAICGEEISVRINR